MVENKLQNIINIWQTLNQFHTTNKEHNRKEIVTLKIAKHMGNILRVHVHHILCVDPAVDKLIFIFGTINAEKKDLKKASTWVTIALEHIKSWDTCTWRRSEI